MKNIVKYILVVLSIVTTCSFTACGGDDDEAQKITSGIIQLSEGQRSINLACDDTWYSVSFTSRANWTATIIEGSNWCSLKETSGMGGKGSLGIIAQKNTSKENRVAKIELKAASEIVQITVTQAYSPVETMDQSQVKNLDKYYKPGEFANMDMFKNDSKWSWWRYKESEHFFVFWEPGFGKDPNSSDVPENLRVDVDELLKKAEQFFNTNVNKLNMATLGQGKSNLDKYKMQIYLLYQDEWLATGSGYDDVIGALWVNPSTCKPVGSTIAHEIGHSFQFQVYADQKANGQTSNNQSGFRYGFGPNGSGGCAYWEQCAQWQSFQDYPAETFGYHISVFMQNQHRHFYHEWMRYASYWLQYYWTEQHGIDVFGNVWKQSKYPEDPIETYTRLYFDGDIERFYDDYFQYAVRCVTYDFKDVHQYVTSEALNHTITMFKTDNGFQPAYAECPGTTGFNIIPLNLKAGSTVSVSLSALAPGSSLVDGDGGQMVDGDGKVVGSTTTYNTQSNKSSNYRFGFVSVKGTTANYGTMAKGNEATVTYDVPTDAEQLYLVIVATPTTYERHAWDDDENNDLQWPYNVKFNGTSLKGYIDIDTNADPKNVTIKKTLKCNASETAYELGKIDLSATDDLVHICQAFAIPTTTFTSSMLGIANGTTVKPEEGKIALGLLQPDGTISYSYTANAGFYCTADGRAGSWNDNDPLWFEYAPSSFILTYGHKPSYSEAGKSYTIKPIFVYTKNGKEYKAILELIINF